MLFPRVFAWLVGLTITLSSLHVVIATGMAGAYERVGPIYQTYRIAIEIWGKDQKKILPPFVGGTHARGGANFLEMVAFIDDVDFTSAEKSNYARDVGSLDSPETHKAAQFLYFNNGDAHTGLIKLNRLFLWGKETVHITTAFAKIRTILATAHTEMKHRGRLEDILPFRQIIDDSHREIIRFRQSDMEGGTDGTRSMAKDIRTKWPSAIVKVESKPWSRDPSFTIYKINVGDTVSASPPDTFKKDELKTWRRSYGQTGDYSEISRNHYNILTQHRTTRKRELKLLTKFCT